MNQSKSGSGVQPTAWRQFGWLLLCLVVLLGFLFRDGLLPSRTVFSNDAPLGALNAASARSPGVFLGYWQDLNWLGATGPSAQPDITQALAIVSGVRQLFTRQNLGPGFDPLIKSKIYAPFALLFLGFGAWLCFRRWKFSAVACLLGGLAAALNSDFFSAACWGVASQPICFGLDFLALAALADQSSRRRWLSVVLAGFAVGMGVMEAYDIGAIFSIVVAAYVLYQALAGEGLAPQKLVRGAMRLAVVVVFAGFIACSAVTTLISTQIKGVAGMGQDTASKAQHWSEATQWSLPKDEVLSLFVPGLFGFRMDTPDGGNYWGACGRAPALDQYLAGGPLEEGEVLRISFEGFPNLDTAQQVSAAGNITIPGVGEVKAGGKTPEELEQDITKTHPQLASQGMKIARERPPGFMRYGGGGIYAGVLVVLVALWALFQSFRKENSVFLASERKFIWFWGAVALVCILVGFGRFAPFYKVFYALPFASMMRNPSKFFHVVAWALVILFAYGVHGLSRRCFEAPGAVSRDLNSQLRTWWAKAAAFDKRWVKGSAIALVVCLAGWFIYSSSRDHLMAYLQRVDFSQEMAGAIASFSIHQVGWFLLRLVLALGLLALVMSGYFNGRRARAGAIMLGLLLVVDLGLANRPWVITWNWQRKYASNPVINFLREQPYEHRVTRLPFNAPGQYSLFTQLYDIEWLQQIFQYYNVQSLDVIMNPRAKEDYLAFENALFFDHTTNTVHRLTRRWQLTNTRYLLGPAPFLDLLNQQIDPVQRRFRIVERFDIVPKPGIVNPTGLDELTAEVAPDGHYAVFDFTGALPRAKLYTHWQVNTNDQATLKDLGSPTFDPTRTVLVADQLPAPSSTTSTNHDAGTVDFASYAPKDLVLKAKADSPSVLLLNDRFDPDWKVTVDGKPAPLLRCNYLMRGVYLQPGPHTVQFQFKPDIDTLYVSLGAVLIALSVLGYVAFAREKQPPSEPAREPSPAKQPRPARELGRAATRD